MATWYAHSSNVNINDANIWHTHPTNNTPVDFATCDGTIILAANAKTGIRINVGFTCLRLSTSPEGGTAGGSFVFTGQNIAGTSIGTVNIFGDVQSGTCDCIVISGSTVSPDTLLTITGNINVMGTCTGISILANNAYLLVHGNVTAGAAHGIAVSGDGVHLTIDGNTIGSSTGYFSGISLICYSPVVYVTGNSIARYESGISIAADEADVTVGGNSYGGSRSESYGIYNGGVCARIRIFGSCIGSSQGGGLINEADNVIIEATQAIGGGSYTANGIMDSGDGTLITVGIAQGGDSLACGIYTTTSLALCNVIITEAVIGGASPTSYGLFSSRSSLAIIKGNIIDSLYSPAYCGIIRVDNSSENYYQTYRLGNEPRRFPLALSADLVKKGTRHGTVIGTLAAASPFRRLNRFI